MMLCRAGSRPSCPAFLYPFECIRRVYFASLTKIAAAWARVAFSLGAKVFSVIPLKMPAAKAHSMAARDSSESEAISSNAVSFDSSVPFAA